MFVGHAVCWVLGETLEAARLGAAAVEVDYEPLPAIVALTEAIDAESFQGGQPVVARGDVEQGLAGAAHVFSGVTEMAGQEHFYLETHASLALVDEGGQVFVQSSTQHPTETQEIVAHVLGLRSPTTSPCSACGWAAASAARRCSRTASPRSRRSAPSSPVGRSGCASSRTHDMTMTGKRHGFHAQWRVGFDDDGRLHGARGDADLRRRLEPRPQRAGARPGAVPRRQRLLDPARAPPRPGGAHPQDLADRVPRLRRTAGDARHRGRPRPLRPAARHRPGRAAPPQLLRRGPGDAVRPGRPPPGARRRGVGPGARRPARSRAAAARSRSSTPPTSTPSARSR